MYQNNKERLQKKEPERYQNLSKEEKENEKRNDVDVTDMKICLETKNKGWLNIEKISSKKVENASRSQEQITFVLLLLVV